MFAALLDDRDAALLRTALAGYTVDGVHERLGLVGQAALERGDLAGVARQLRDDGPLETVIRLFVLGAEVAEHAARAALAPLPLERALAAGLVASSAGRVRAEIDIRPHAAQGDPQDDWLVVSDLGPELRRRPMTADHVLGVSASALTLAQAVPRDPVAGALDVGTGCGVQALHLGRHADLVVATDTNPRALRFAATTAALSGQKWELRSGSLLQPVAGERYDLVVSNPPYVVSPGGTDYEYRDSGWPGDQLCKRLVSDLPALLTPGGIGQLTANWAILADQPWDERIAGWFAGGGCDAWVWQRDVADPGEYAALWLREDGERPGTARWQQRYDDWLDWFAAEGVVAVGMGLITLWRTDADHPVLVVEDVPQAYERPIGAELPRWHARQRWLTATRNEALLTSCLAPAPGLVRECSELLGGEGWAAAGGRLRQLYGLRWTIDIDDAISALIAGCAGGAPLGTVLELLAAAQGAPPGEAAEAALPIVRDLIARGFLLPPDGAP